MEFTILAAEIASSDAGTASIFGAFVFAVLVVWFGQVGSEELKRWWFAPQLTFLGDSKTNGLHVYTSARRPDKKPEHIRDVPYFPAEYIRIAIRNNGRTTAKNCRVFLMDLRTDTGCLLVPPYLDFLQLRGAYTEPNVIFGDGIDIPPGAVCHFDVASIQFGPAIMLEFASKTALESPDFMNLLTDGSGYEAFIVATSETTKPRYCSARFSIPETPHPRTPTFTGVTIRSIRPSELPDS